MRAVVARVSSASVEVEGEIVGSIQAGLLVLVGVHRDDAKENAVALADRVAGLRIFSDEAGKMNRDLASIEGSILAVPNFTLWADVKSRRPSFGASAPFEAGKAGFEAFVGALRDRGIAVQTGVFGADMKVASVNDGPVTLVIEA